ncbi:MAG: chromosomal replication initiator protein DnaA [Planctomycetes bacterium]|nr:chromosomal replication initiator protein DnaA [Planctomycetota bacterium]
MQPRVPVCADATDPAVEAIARRLKELIGEQQFDRWFQQKTRLLIEGSELIVCAANPFLQKFLQKQHRAALSAAGQAVLGPSMSVRFSVDPNLMTPQAPARSDAPLRTVAAGSEPTPVSQRTGPRESAPTTSAAPIQTGRRFSKLEDFVPGSCNQLVLTAVRQVSERPDGSSGPLFVYGPVGSGKTHLLEGLYCEIRRRHPALNVVFLTSEQFTNQFTQSFRNHSTPMFRQRFRTVDVLLIDDIDFLDAKRVVQEEFLHTIQQLESYGKQVIVCGERHPRQLTKISEELKTRFLSGMVCRLEAADLETRNRIAVAKAQRLQLEISPEALKYVAQRFGSSVRELEGALCCLQVYYRMSAKRVGVSAARDVLGDLERDCLRIVRMADIERVVCNLFGVEAAELKSPRRNRSVSEPRMLAMFLARRHTRAAYSEIGAYFGGRNHATVIAADQKITAGLSQDLEIKIASRTWRLADVVESLEQQLLAG